MAESSTPSGEEQLSIIVALLLEDYNRLMAPDTPKADKLETPSDDRNDYEDLLDIHEERNQYYTDWWYMVASRWIYRWLHHVKHFDKAVYPGKLTMVDGEAFCGIPEFYDLDKMNSEDDCSKNKWVSETVWCKWVQWYGVEDGHELDRYEPCCEIGYEHVQISLKGDVGARLANTPKCVCVDDEKCGYIELQLRRIFGVTHDTETQLWLDEKTPNNTLLDRSKELSNYTDPEVKGRLTLQLEICPPSEGKGATENYFDKYVHLTGRPRIKGDDTSVVLKSTVEGFGKTLQDTMGSVVELEAMKNGVRKTQKELDEKIRVACEKEKEHDTKEVQLQKEKNQLQQEIQVMSEINTIQDSCIKLNIGGHIYTTSILTLTKDPQSMLATMFSGRHSVKKEQDGCYFIDRGGTHFRYILNYLRDGGFKDGLLPSDILMELQTEAEYYQLSGLVALLRRDGSTTT